MGTTKRVQRLVRAGIIGLVAWSASVQAAEEKILNLYNWSDYIAEDTIRNFEKETGIKVRYDTFDANEILHAKLIAGKTGYDVVVPGAAWAKLQRRSASRHPRFTTISPASRRFLMPSWNQRLPTTKKIRAFCFQFIIYLNL